MGYASEEAAEFLDDPKLYLRWKAPPRTGLRLLGTTEKGGPVSQSVRDVVKRGASE
jgi:hypothetical protein